MARLLYATIGLLLVSAGLLIVAPGATAAQQCVIGGFWVGETWGCVDGDLSTVMWCAEIEVADNWASICAHRSPTSTGVECWTTGLVVYECEDYT
jgi:hypothetical protein